MSPFFRAVCGCAQGRKLLIGDPAHKKLLDNKKKQLLKEEFTKDLVWFPVVVTNTWRPRHVRRTQNVVRARDLPRALVPSRLCALRRAGGPPALVPRCPRALVPSCPRALLSFFPSALRPRALH